MTDQPPLFWVDPRPPDSYDLNYMGQACRDRQHERCPGWWGDSLRSGKGTRCVCLCHEGGDASEDTTPIPDEYGAVYPCPNCGRDSGGPEGAACVDCFNDALEGAETGEATRDA